VSETVHHLGADDQDKDDAEYMTKQLIEEYQKWGLNINILKAECLNVGSGIQNIKLECNIESKGSRSFWYLVSHLYELCKCSLQTLENAMKKC